MKNNDKQEFVKWALAQLTMQSGKDKSYLKQETERIKDILLKKIADDPSPMSDEQLIEFIHNQVQADFSHQQSEAQIPSKAPLPTLKSMLKEWQQQK